MIFAFFVLKIGLQLFYSYLTFFLLDTYNKCEIFNARKRK